ncbi:MAG: hypothetical protein QNK27_07325 [Desulfuromusa sp.]|nr:hypothetical protein [Desulfuromusa sp.]
MNIKSRIALNIVVAVLFLYSFSAFADMNKSCRLLGSYGYLYNGTSYSASGSVPLTETGFLTIDNDGNLSGEGTLAFYFSDFGGSGLPLWLLLHEVQSNGVVTQDTNNTCGGTVDFLATATVIKTSDPSLVPEGTVLFTDSPRSLAYTISGSGKGTTVDMISTSPGTIASGTAHKQKKRR